MNEILSFTNRLGDAIAELNKSVVELVRSIKDVQDKLDSARSIASESSKFRGKMKAEFAIIPIPGEDET